MKLLLVIAFFVVFTLVIGAPIMVECYNNYVDNRDMVVRLSNDKASIAISGAVGNELSNLLSRLLSENPQIHTITLGNNRGGYMNDLAAIKHRLPDQKIDRLIVTGDCRSACAYLAILPVAGIKTYAINKASLGFHRLTNYRGDGARGRERFLSPLRQAYGAELIDAWYSSRKITEVSSQTLLNRAMIQGCVADPDFHQTPCEGPTHSSVN